MNFFVKLLAGKQIIQLEQERNTALLKLEPTSRENYDLKARIVTLQGDNLDIQMTHQILVGKYDTLVDENHKLMEENTRLKSDWKDIPTIAKKTAIRTPRKKKDE